MTYPLPSGTAESAVTEIILPPMTPILEIIPTRVSGDITLKAYSRTAKVEIISTPQAPILEVTPQRQWGLAPAFEVVSDSWGVF